MSKLVRSSKTKIIGVDVTVTIRAVRAIDILPLIGSPFLDLAPKDDGVTSPSAEDWAKNKAAAIVAAHTFADDGIPVFSGAEDVLRALDMGQFRQLFEDIVALSNMTKEAESLASHFRDGNGEAPCVEAPSNGSSLRASAGASTPGARG